MNTIWHMFWPYLAFRSKPFPAGLLALLGGFLPEILTKSMGVALYALLLAILLPEIKQSVKALILTITSGVLNTILIKLDILPNGWNIIVCIIVIAFFGSFFISGEIKEAAYE